MKKDKIVKDCEREKRDREMGHEVRQKKCPNFRDEDGERNRNIEKDRKRNLHRR